MDRRKKSVIFEPKRTTLKTKLNYLQKKKRPKVLREINKALLGEEVQHRFQDEIYQDSGILSSFKFALIT